MSKPALPLSIMVLLAANQEVFELADRIVGVTPRLDDNTYKLWHKFFKLCMQYGITEADYDSDWSFEELKDSVTHLRKVR